MANAFIRYYKLSIYPAGSDTLVFKDQHIEFTVGQSSNSDPNTLELDIYNLSDGTVALLDKKDSMIKLEAGYVDGGSGLIFRGNKTSSYTFRSGPDIITHIQAVDGAKEIRESRCEDTLPKQVTLKQVLESIIEKGFPKYSKNLKGDILTKKIFNGGISYVGSAKQQLDTYTKPYGLEWNILNCDTINIFPINSVLTNQREYVLLSPASGLIGFPEKMTKDFDSLDDDKEKTKETGLRLQSLLNHKLISGHKVRVEGTGVKPNGTKKSFSVDGEYKITKVTHSGSYEGDNWTTEIEVSELR